MTTKIKVRQLVKPKKSDQNEMVESLVVPFCGSGYRTGGGSTNCNSGYSSNLWCVTKPESEDEVLL
jgi:hypothetical protein